jgi:hypothetical protein
MSDELTAVTGINLVAAERQKQRERFGDAHDDGHTSKELIYAARAYLDEARGGYGHASWPWADDQYRPSDSSIDNLVRAAALICAEIDRRLRATPAASPAPDR